MFVVRGANGYICESREVGKEGQEETYKTRREAEKVKQQLEATFSSKFFYVENILELNIETANELIAEGIDCQDCGQQQALYFDGWDCVCADCLEDNDHLLDDEY